MGGEGVVAHRPEHVLRPKLLLIWGHRLCMQAGLHEGLLYSVLLPVHLCISDACQ